MPSEFGCEGKLKIKDRRKVINQNYIYEKRDLSIAGLVMLVNSVGVKLAVVTQGLYTNWIKFPTSKLVYVLRYTSERNL